MLFDVHGLVAAGKRREEAEIMGERIDKGN